MKSLLSLNPYFYRYRWRLLLGVVFIAVSNFFAVQSVTYIRKGIDFVKELNPGGGAAEINSKLIYFASMTLALALLQGFFMFLMRQTIIVMSRLIEYDQKNDVFAHYQKLDAGFYKRNSTGDLMNRISEDVSRVRMYIGPSVMYVVNTLMTFGFTIGIMLKVDEKLTLLTLLPLPVLAISIYFVSSSLNRKSNRVQEELSNLSTLAQETFSGIRVIKSFGKESTWSGEFKEASEKYKKKSLDLILTDSLFQPCMLLLIGLSTIITIYVGSREAIDGKISIGNIAEFIIYVSRLTWPVASLGWVTSLIQRAAASQKRIDQFLLATPEIQSGTAPKSVLRGDLEFLNVSFSYPDSGITALKDVSFKLEAGKSLAILGHTGSGKSTVANLICRLYDPTSGEIRIDGKNIRTMNLSDLRNQIGYVPQEVFLFSDSISNNIAFSSGDHPGFQISNELIEQAARDAAVYANISEFPDNFRTVVGERGITLSGGQKQRISIARAIIKEPRILLFDDCLSAVDTQTEEEILNNLNRIMKGKTTLIFSHRVSSVKNSEQIIVLDQGKIIEQGTHAQLLDKKGNYFDLYQKQLLEKAQESI